MILEVYNVQLTNLIPSALQGNDPPQTIEDVGREIEQVTVIIKQSALSTIPTIKPRRSTRIYINDSTLKMKCKASKHAWSSWKNAGRPRAGPLYDTMKSTKKEVTMYVSQCRAREERARIQQRARKSNLHGSVFQGEKLLAKSWLLMEKSSPRRLHY